MASAKRDTAFGLPSDSEDAEEMVRRVLSMATLQETCQPTAFAHASKGGVALERLPPHSKAPAVPS